MASEPAPESRQGDGLFDTLPEEAVAEILQWLEPGTVQLILPLVSRGMAAIVHSDRVWQVCTPPILASRHTTHHSCEVEKRPRPEVSPPGYTR